MVIDDVNDSSVAAASLELVDFAAGYFKGRWVVSGVNLKVYPGRVLGLVGPNGSGKSTLIRGMGGWMPHTAGSVKVASGESIYQMSPGSRAGLISVLPQSPEKPESMTVEDFVDLGHFHQSGFGYQTGSAFQENLAETLNQFNLSEVSHHALANLSGGEYQRARLAQMDMAGADIYLMDEPASFLDWDYQSFLYSYCRYKAEQGGKSIVMAVHDLNMASSVCDDICLMHQGTIVDSGPAQSLLHPDKIQKIYPNVHQFGEVDINGKKTRFFPVTPHTAWNGKIHQ